MKWLQLMLGAMLTNGFALVGLKVLAEAGLSPQYQSHYLLAWYASGLAIAAVYSLKGLAKPNLREIGIGGAMSAMSFTGQVCLSLALSGGAPGYLVYPIGAGASVLFVAVIGVLVFREKLTLYGVAGIACGLISVVILSLP
jgi:multidrug transporter EmrE-like cation transporter